jgi:NAD(P)-dependent dehydrogenase (short-subunit alcohol dehydrogenase family)
MRDLSGRVAVVTGAGSGIGRALAQELGRRGCRLALLDRDGEGLAGTTASLGDVPVLARQVDVAVVDQVDDAAAAVVEHFGQADILINNAGLSHGGRPFWELPAGDFARVVAVNFWGVVHGSRAFLPHLMARPEAVLVNVSSVFGLIGVRQQSAYCASKFAVRGFTESLRMELRESAPHVRAVTVHPGGVRTAIARNVLPAGQSEQVRRAAAEAFDGVARTSPASAATTIVRGIVNGRERVLVGPDARLLDLVARALPRRYTGLLLRPMQSVGTPQPAAPDGTTPD